MQNDEQNQQWQQPQQSQAQAPYQPLEPVQQMQQAQEADQSDFAQVVEGEMPSSQSEEAPDESPELDNNTSSDQYRQESDEALVQWQATEYIHHDRGSLWFVGLGAVVFVLLIVALFLMRSYTFAALIAVMLIAVIVYVRRPPTQFTYSLSRKGLHVNDKLYTYDQFRAFGIDSHPEYHAAVLIPRKRFQLGQTLYFPDEVGESLVDMLASRLPMQDYKPDLIDRLLTRIRL